MWNETSLYEDVAWSPATCVCLFCQAGRLFPAGERPMPPPPPPDYDDDDEEKLPPHSGSVIALNKLRRRRTYYYPTKYTRRAT